MARDIKLIQDSKGGWDIDFENGDIKATDSLDTALYMSVFCEKRADANQVPSASLRRGHFSNQFNQIEDYEIGSLIWLYIDQNSNTDENLNLINGSARDGIQWMVDDGLIKDYEVTSVKQGNSIDLEINLVSDQESNYYNLFLNTFNDN